MPKWFVRLAFLVVAIIGLTVFSMPQAQAAQEADAVSPGYRFEESVIGGGGLIQSSSASYQTNGLVLGDTAVGETSSDNFTFGAGNKTTPDPALTFGIVSGNATFNQVFRTDETAVASAQFSVINYTSYGYSIQISGDAPKHTISGHEIEPMAIAGISAPGIEQFGVNLVANTDPNVGASLFYPPPYFGKNAKISDDYKTPNTFKYASDEQVARGESSSGQTDFTISYIVNVNNLTPAGAYKATQTVICTGTY